MSKARIKLTGLLGLSAVALAIPTLALGAWDGDSWWYTPETHTPVIVATAEGSMTGLDAKARGFDGSAGDTEVDKWYWDMEYSNACDVDFDPPGGMIIIR